MFTFITRLFVTKQVRHLGRWNLKNNDFIKTDLANVDNCGDLLCKLPEKSLSINNKSSKKLIKECKNAAYWG